MVSGGLLRWREEVELSSEVEWLQQVRLGKFEWWMAGEVERLKEIEWMEFDY